MAIRQEEQDTTNTLPPPSQGEQGSASSTTRQDTENDLQDAQRETHGGPLGCCLGVISGLFLSLTIGVLSRLYADPLTQFLHGNLAITVRLLMACCALASAVIFGYLGWKAGQKMYREY